MSDRITRTTAGHSWITGDRAPEVPGYECFFVAHYGNDRTEWIYRPAASEPESVSGGVSPLAGARMPERSGSLAAASFDPYTNRPARLRR
jgi:hypothetical protein